MTLTGWRWLIYKEAELEANMEAVLFKNDLQMYHRVKLMEMTKIEEGLSDEFGCPLSDLLWRKEALGEDSQTKEFEDKLRDMLEGADKVCLGLDSRLDLWRLIDRIPVILFSKDGKSLLSHATLC